MDYKELYDIFISEKRITELQELPTSFYEEVNKYINEKKKICDEISSQEEREKIQNEIKNIKKISDRIYDFRERKVVQNAIIFARHPDHIVFTERFMENEKLLFDKLVEVFKEVRQKANI